MLLLRGKPGAALYSVLQPSYSGIFTKSQYTNANYYELEIMRLLCIIPLKKNVNSIVKIPYKGCSILALEIHVHKASAWQQESAP